MPTSVRTKLRTAAAVRYVNVEMTRGLIEIIRTVGLSLTPLHDCRVALEDAAMQHLVARDLNYIGLAFLRDNKLLDHYGMWLIEIHYGGGEDTGRQFPVQTIKQDLRRAVLRNAHSYRIYLYTTDRILIFPSGRSLTYAEGDCDGGRWLGAFGFTPIGAGVHRVRIRRGLGERLRRLW